MELIDKETAIQALRQQVDYMSDAMYYRQRKGMLRAIDVVSGIDPAEQWIPCSERLPGDDEEAEVFVTCESKNAYGKPYRYTCKASYVEKYSVEADWKWDKGCDEYREEDDKYYVREGWYKRIFSWCGYSFVAIEDKVLAWCELPAPYRGGATNGTD